MPPDLPLDAAWADVERVRESSSQTLPLLVDEKARPYRIYMTPAMLQSIHSVDRHGADSMFRAGDERTRRQLIIEAAVEEAFHSSKIEGAVTTLAKARDLAAGKVEAQTKSERMVLNNYRAMQRILEWRSRPLDLDEILELHRIVTDQAYEGRDGTEGKLREDDTVRVVHRSTEEIVHIPPPARELPGLLHKMIAFMNEPAGVDGGAEFVNPLVRASAVHYYLGYLHPFYDGNGRTARALFYHYMLRQGYDSFQFLSISTVIDRRRAQYYRAFRQVEASPTDLTYFVLFSCRAVESAVEALRARVLHEYGSVAVLDPLRERHILLNDRQERPQRRLPRRLVKAADVLVRPPAGHDAND
ncbi:MAG TPA: Fic family protein [Planctomycetota bacterium]|nr:Fic family protein [Planctomycetota bacterium]